MDVSAAGVQFIAGFEGYEANWYDDGFGTQTIGYGHTGKLPSGFKAPLSKQRASDLLHYDLRSYVAAVNHGVTTTVTQSQFDALVSFAYNLGVGRGGLADLFSGVNARKFAAVAKQMLEYDHAGGRKIPGLTRRRKAESALFLRAIPTPKPAPFKNLIAERQFYTNQYAVHHGLPIPHLTVDGVRGAQSKEAFKLVLFYLGYNGTDWRAAKYNLVDDQQAINWLKHPSLRNPAMKAKGAYRQRHPRGLVIVSPGANLSGHPIHPWVLSDVERIALYARQAITILTGTNHCKYVLCDPSQNISDHWAGNAADLSPNGPDDGSNGDLICASALRVAGLSEADAWRQARAGGEHVNVHGGYRYDVLWKTDIGGNHHNHIHFGVRPA